MADEDKNPKDPKDAEEVKDPKDPKDTKDPKDAEEVKEPESAEGVKEQEAPAEKPKTDDEKTQETPAKETSSEKASAEETKPEPEPKPEPVSPIAAEMQDTSAHKGKMIGAEDVRPGMTVRVHERIIDISPKGQERERIQVFEGIVLGAKGAGNKRTFTVRKISGGIGVEKIFPISSPNVTKIEVVKIAKVRRAKLTFLKNLKRRFKRKLKESWVE